MGRIILVKGIFKWQGKLLFLVTGRFISVYKLQVDHHTWSMNSSLNRRILQVRIPCIYEYV